MNIEEERKAFEESRKKLCDFDKGWEFGIWLAAKAHAGEMAPRWVRVRRKGVHSEPSSYPWLVVCLESGVLEDFRSEESAREWAEQCGYRVVSE